MKEGWPQSPESEARNHLWWLLLIVKGILVGLGIQLVREVESRWHLIEQLFDAIERLIIAIQYWL